MVSPAYKEGYHADFDALSEDGTRVASSSFGSFAGTEDTSLLGQGYEFTRGEGEWDAFPVDEPYAEIPFYLTMSYSSDLRRVQFGAFTPAGGKRTTIFAASPGGPPTAVGPASPPSLVESSLTLTGASDDLTHAIYYDSSPQNAGDREFLWPGDTTALGGWPSLYEYVGTGNSEPRLVGVSDVGTPASVAASHLISDCGTDLGGFPKNTEAYNAVSSSGATVFFTAAPSGVCGAAGPPVYELYARIEASRTVAISEPSEADCEECNTKAGSMADAFFRGASREGSRVFFVTAQKLLPGAIGAGPYLYGYNFQAPARHKITLLSAGDPAGPAVQGVARVSEDGSHVYFVAHGVLTAANREGRAPAAGQPNLYVSISECPGTANSCPSPVYHVSFVATLSNTDEADWSSEDTRPVQATPDGRFLVFQSAADLTLDQGESREAGQVFEYDAADERLVRISRGQGGFNDDGNSETFAATVPDPNGSFSEPVDHSKGLALSADGTRVFFSSHDALTPQALQGFNNIYEYHAGEVSLISDGQDVTFTQGHPALLLDGTDASGLDVFFQTADRLVPQDTDNQVDIYDARVGGGPPPTISGAPCAGASCHSAVSVLEAPPGTAPVTGEAPISPSSDRPPPPKSLTNAQRLVKALKVCAGKPKRRRAACRLSARKRFEPRTRRAAGSNKGVKR
ncbi:MAG TPA: hypothetical protein VGH60_07015 [Solirubrobacteraceae bacterium]